MQPAHHELVAHILHNLHFNIFQPYHWDPAMLLAVALFRGASSFFLRKICSKADRASDQNPTFRKRSDFCASGDLRSTSHTEALL